MIAYLQYYLPLIDWPKDTLQAFFFLEQDSPLVLSRTARRLTTTNCAGPPPPSSHFKTFFML